MARNFEFRLPLAWLHVTPCSDPTSDSQPGKVRVRFSLWQDHLPVDALPLEGWIELTLCTEEEMISMAF